MNRNKRAGDRYEREVQQMLRDLLQLPDARRALGAGRQDDVGDIHAVPDTCIQVAGTIHDENVSTIAKAKLDAVEKQRQRAGATHSAVFLRVRGGVWRVLVDQLEANRLGIAEPDLICPESVPGGIAVRHVVATAASIYKLAPVVFVDRLVAYAMTPESWAVWWGNARRRETAAAGVTVA